MSSKDKILKQKPGKDYQYGGFELEKYNNIVDFLHSNKIPNFGISNSDKAVMKSKIGNFECMCKDFCMGANGVTLLYIKTMASKKKKQAASKDPIAEEEHSDDSDQDHSSDFKHFPTQTESKPRKVLLKGQVKRVIEEVHKEVGKMVKNTYTTIKEHYYWDVIQWDCEAFCTMCPCCQRNKPFKVEAPTLHPVPPPREALTQWGMLRTHVPRATKYSPFELVYGFKARFAVDNKLEEGSEQAGEDEDEEQRIMIYLASIDAHFDGIKHQRNIAHANIKIEQAKQKKAYDEKHTPCPFKKGDLVKLQQSRKGTRQGGKMLPNFIGPLTMLVAIKSAQARLASPKDNYYHGMKKLRTLIDRLKEISTPGQESKNQNKQSCQSQARKKESHHNKNNQQVTKMTSARQ
uniref:Integrase zinc-binding domain-containing protein n=1 Tax=Plectus sambesii TaxID=2011161 RepID=A0A914WM61_9BILA